MGRAEAVERSRARAERRDIDGTCIVWGLERRTQTIGSKKKILRRE